MQSQVPYILDLNTVLKGKMLKIPRPTTQIELTKAARNQACSVLNYLYEFIQATINFFLRMAIIEYEFCKRINNF